MKAIAGVGGAADAIAAARPMQLQHWQRRNYSIGKPNRERGA
jgi:hypothetical protein